MRQTLLLVTALVLCLAACKVEPDLPDDPHIPLVNPFVGVWKDGMGMSAQYWQFSADGTGGKADTQSGTFPNTFSFFIYTGQDTQNPTERNLIILDDNGAGGVNVTRYRFTIAGNQAVLTESPGVNVITLEQVNVSPQVLNVANPLNQLNPLIGEWSADWSWPGEDHDGGTWSLKYRNDGTLKLYHHQSHQFENGYALRGNTLVIFGAYRFGSFAGMPIIAEINQLGNGKWNVQEIQTSPSQGPATWTYTKVNAAKWK